MFFWYCVCSGLILQVYRRCGRLGRLRRGKIQRTGSARTTGSGDRSAWPLQKEPWIDTEERAQLAGLGRADGALPGQGFVDMTALSENGVRSWVAVLPEWSTRNCNAAAGDDSSDGSAVRSS